MSQYYYEIYYNIILYVYLNNVVSCFFLWILVCILPFRVHMLKGLIASVNRQSTQIFVCVCTINRVATSWKKSLKSLNFTQVLEIPEKSLNFNSNFERSLKSPWILKMILEVLELWVWNALQQTFYQIGGATCHTSLLHVTFLQLFCDMWLNSVLSENM